MKIYEKIKAPNGVRTVYICGIKVCRYKKTTADNYSYNTKYGIIYSPLYNRDVMMSSDEHKIFNNNGEPMRTFFIRDIHTAHIPTYESKYFIWDRWNIGLNTHFYSHGAMLQTMGNPDKKYGMLIESEAIVPDDYTIFDRNPGLAEDFDLIFTYSEGLLNKLPNARFVPFVANIWGEPAEPDCYKYKTKNVSILASNKCMCDMHTFRLALARKCRDERLCDTFGTFDGGSRVQDIADTYRKYRFCICLENDVKPYYFTERFTTALANQCIPIYLGASKIDKFFNPDGIIKITRQSDIKKILSQCTEDEYNDRISAVLDNYNRAMQYKNSFDYMYEKYL